KLDSQNYQSGRIQVEYRPTEKLTNSLMLDGYHAHQNGTALIPTNFSAIAKGIYNGFVNPFPALISNADYFALVPVPLAT
ncbi:unnamed protein product, partial [marine sediment metagenome]